MDNLLLWLSLSALALSVLGLFVALFNQRRLQRKVETLQHSVVQLETQKQALTQTQQLSQTLAKEVNELRAGAVAIARRLGSVEQGLGELAQNQPNPELLEPERRLYRRAVRMVELGADLDEIMQECELPRAEAELLLNLHRQKQSL